jgi:hypothetical protein
MLIIVVLSYPWEIEPELVLNLYNLLVTKTATE